MSECSRKRTKKYTTRKSPPYPANDCPNMIKRGNDKKNYKSEADKNGVHKWKLSTKRKTLKKKPVAKRKLSVAKRKPAAANGESKKIKKKPHKYNSRLMRSYSSSPPTLHYYLYPKRSPGRTRSGRNRAHTLSTH
tara:strand:- start:464 stop:868 length:405 start_codon:yes stop_codon:yes gene_type:complete